MSDSEKQLSIVEIAKKKRYLALMEKVQRGPALTSSEIKELARLENAKDESPGTVDTMREVADAFGVSLRAVQYWVQGGMPKSKDSGYDLITIQRWRLLKKTKKCNGDSDEKIQWETRYRQMKALIAEIEYKKLTGDLVPREGVEATMMSRIVAIKKQFLALPKRVAPQLEGLETIEREELLMDRLKEIIQEFADGLIGSSKQ